MYPFSKSEVNKHQQDILAKDKVPQISEWSP